MFRLDAIDAYNQKLVKKIEVRGIKQIGSTATNGYVYLEEIIISKGNPQARISYDVKTATGTKQTRSWASTPLGQPSPSMTSWCSTACVQRRTLQNLWNVKMMSWFIPSCQMAST